MDNKQLEKKSVIERLLNKEFVKRLEVKTINDLRIFVKIRSESSMNSQTFEKRENNIESNTTAMDSEKMSGSKSENTTNKKSETKRKTIEQLNSNSMTIKRKRYNSAEHEFKKLLNPRLECTVCDKLLVKFNCSHTFCFADIELRQRYDNRQRCLICREECDDRVVADITGENSETVAKKRVKLFDWREKSMAKTNHSTPRESAVLLSTLELGLSDTSRSSIDVHEVDMNSLLNSGNETLNVEHTDTSNSQLAKINSRYCC